MTLTTFCFILALVAFSMLIGVGADMFDPSSKKEKAFFALILSYIAGSAIYTGLLAGSVV